MSKPAVRIAVGAYDRTQQLLTAAEPVPGFDAEVVAGDLEEIFARAFSEAEFEVTELSFSNYLITVARGACPYIALPIFPSRSFRHSALYVRPGSGIASPRDLAGKRIGTREYSNTVSLVVRGILADEYGYQPESSEWVVGDVDHAERKTIDPRNWPTTGGVSIAARPGVLLSDLMAQGELDALLAYTPPRDFGQPGGPMRLFPDWRAVEHSYYRRTKRFPIMHVMAIRRDVLAAQPTLPAALMQAFGRAKDWAQAQLAIHQALPIMLPWMTAEAESTHAVMGEDFWPYGLEANRNMLETQVRWSREQGLIARAPALDELFVSP